MLEAHYYPQFYCFFSRHLHGSLCTTLGLREMTEVVFGPKKVHWVLPSSFLFDPFLFALCYLEGDKKGGTRKLVLAASCFLHCTNSVGTDGISTHLAKSQPTLGSWQVLTLIREPQLQSSRISHLVCTERACLASVFEINLVDSVTDWQQLVVLSFSQAVLFRYVLN